MMNDILEMLLWLSVATLGIVLSGYGLYLMAVEDPWDMVYITGGFGLLGTVILKMWD
tara:strand:+ start:320 stop:490 length:171 start_codon:yes stop_codon:yes gene_type:complete